MVKACEGQHFLDGAVYVSDVNNNRVVKLAAGSSTPTVVLTQINPAGLAVDNAGSVYFGEVGYPNDNDQVMKLEAA